MAINEHRGLDADPALALRAEPLRVSSLRASIGAREFRS